MNIEHHITELEKRIESIEKEPTKGWIGKVSKSVKIKRIERKIKSLRRELEK